MGYRLVFRGAPELTVIHTPTGARLSVGDGIDLVEMVDVSLGRASNNVLKCDSPLVSRSHVSCRLEGDRLAVRTGRYATNGFLVDDVRADSGRGTRLAFPAESPTDDLRRFTFELVAS